MPVWSVCGDTSDHSYIGLHAVMQATDWQCVSCM